jgi:hypothetical protein
MMADICERSASNVRMKRAQQLEIEHDVEVWQQARLVARMPSSTPPRPWDVEQ